MLQMLNKKVEEVYRNCIGDNEANIRYGMGGCWCENCLPLICAQ